MPHFDDKGATESQDAVPEAPESAKALRFRVACRMLRLSGSIDGILPDQKRGESQIDWFVRHGVAIDKYAAAEALISAKDMVRVLNETMRELMLLDNKQEAK